MGPYGPDNCRRRWSSEPEHNAQSNHVRRSGAPMDFRKMTACTSHRERDWHGPSHRARAGEVRPAANIKNRRFNRVIGFWLGGILFAAGGCLFGVTRPYEHPASVAASALWWSIYFGCFGMSIGALLGLWAEKTLGCPSRRSEGRGKSSVERMTPASQAAAPVLFAEGAGRTSAVGRVPPFPRWSRRR